MTSGGKPKSAFLAEVTPLERLRVRRQFLKVAASGAKSAMPGLVVQARPFDKESAESETIRVGFTASKKVGNSVERNRARRRLRALASEVMPRHAMPRYDYVLIGRKATLSRPYLLLRQDLETALKRMKLIRPVDASLAKGLPA